MTEIRPVEMLINELRAELQSLAEKIMRLREFTGSETFSQMHHSHRHLLAQQFAAMVKYQKALQQRIELLVEECPEMEDVPGIVSDCASIGEVGLSGGLAKRLERAGFLTVGSLREGYISVLQDGYDMTGLPGVGEASVEELEAKVFNDMDYLAEADRTDPAAPRRVACV